MNKSFKGVLSNIWCLRNPMNRGGWWATVHGVASARHDLVHHHQFAELLVKPREQCFIEPWAQPVNFQTNEKAHCKQIKQELSIFEVIKVTEIYKFKSCPTQASISFVLLNVTSSLAFLHGSCYPAGIGQAAPWRTKTLLLQWIFAVNVSGWFLLRAFVSN